MKRIIIALGISLMLCISSFAMNITIKNTMASSASAVLQAGTIQLYGGSTAPSGWLLCDGSAVSRTTYPDLFAVIGTTYGTGDASTTFNVPDFRGASAFGAGTSTGYTSNETYVLGTKYNDQIQGHWHLAGRYGAFGTGGGGVGVTDATFTGTNFVHEPINDGTNGTPRTGTTTRGKGVGVNYIIKTTNGIALVGVNGWTDGGTLVSLETITDNVNIGSSESRQKLSVYGTIETYGTGGIKFQDGTTQTSAFTVKMKTLSATLSATGAYTFSDIGLTGYTFYGAVLAFVYITGQEEYCYTDITNPAVQLYSRYEPDTDDFVVTGGSVDQANKVIRVIVFYL